MRKLLLFFYIVFLVLVLSFPRIFWEVKLVVLIPLLLFGVLRVFSGDLLRLGSLYFMLLYFSLFIWFGIVGLTKGNDIDAIVDEFRLQIVFPLVFLFFIFAQTSLDYNLSFFHRAVLISCLFITGSFIYLFLSYFFGLYVPEYFVDGFQMVMGVHPNYIQVNMESVGMLFFIIPYLMTYILIKTDKLPFWEIIALLFVVICAFLSGRRALWLCLLVAPFVSIALIKIASIKQRLGFYNYSFIFILGSIFLMYMVFEKGIFDYVAVAFSSIDERSMQKPYLVNGFYQNFVVGSGIGGVVDYVRSYSQPWLFELTYHQRLFNYGLFGFLTFHALIFIYSIIKIRYSSYFVQNYYVSIGAGVLILFIGSYSNPYLGSFDFLFLVWLFFLCGCVSSSVKNGCN